MSLKFIATNVGKVQIGISLVDISRMIKHWKFVDLTYGKKN